MKAAVEARKVTQKGVLDECEYSISEPDAAHLMTILRDTLYKDPILAPLREYSSNAWDEHRESGNSDVPIKVIMPTSMSPMLVIRDFGRGLGHWGMFNTYVRYGKSTKRESNVGVGTLGLGSKSGFAYSDSWNIISRHEEWFNLVPEDFSLFTPWPTLAKLEVCSRRVCRIYTALLDEGECGSIKLLSEEPLEEDEKTGIEIQIPVEESDIHTFREKAEWLFRHFRPRPDINIELPELDENSVELEHGTLVPGQPSSYYSKIQGGGSWIAVMGCVPYAIDLEQLQDTGVDAFRALHNLSGVVRFPIGVVDISASREALKYTSRTKTALIEKFEALIDEYVEGLLDGLRGRTITWNIRLGAQILRQLELPIPLGEQDKAVKKVKMPEENTFFFYRPQSKAAVTHLPVAKTTRLVLRDDDRDLKGFCFLSGDYLVRPKDEYTAKEVAPYLDTALEAAGLVGIPIEKLSNLRWEPPFVPYSERKKVKDPKHRIATFKFLGLHRCDKLSDRWEIEKREPKATDVYVILYRFKGHDYNFYRDYKADLTLAVSFGLKLPQVYGYKTTAKKRRDETNTIGIPYWKWREQFVQSLVTPEVREEILCRHWASVVPSRKRRSVRDRSPKANYWHKIMIEPKHPFYLVLQHALGLDHPMVVFFRRGYEARKQMQLVGPVSKKERLKAKARQEALDRLEDRVQASQVPTGMQEFLHRRYPLLASSGLDELWGPEGHEWLDYIKMIDASRGLKSPSFGVDK